MINDFKVASRSLLELLFPTLCVGCKKYGELVCKECYESIHFNQESSIVYDNLKIISAADYQQRIIFKIITSLKYGLLKNLDKYCARIIYDFISIHGITFADNTVITFVPMHHRKESLRGFNQAKLIAGQLSELLNLPCFDLLTKTKHTKSQMLLNREQRMHNLTNCFRAINCRSKNIILLDDVVTTGTTLKECANTLLKAGASSVTCLTLCKD